MMRSMVVMDMKIFWVNKYSYTAPNVYVFTQ
jgi:hypothetical protein